MEVPPAEQIDKQVNKIQAQAQEDELQAVIGKLKTATKWPVYHEIFYRKTRRQLQEAGYRVSVVCNGTFVDNNYKRCYSDDNVFKILPNKSSCTIN